jgi:sulfopropanediol 3-dehydrogenase
MAEYLKRPTSGSEQIAARVRSDVAEMLLRIERGGEPAIREYSERLDGWCPPSFRVTDDAVRLAAEATPAPLREHIAFAQAQVRAFAAAQRGTMRDLRCEPLPGVVLGHRHVPVGSVGAYVPGGRYPMLASSFMTVLVAKAAGVGRVVACAPPREGRGIPAPMLHAIATSGADEIVCLGGVQALAALALGIHDLEPVDMLVGAGNAYVAEAKRQLFGRVGLDLLAGPTEILVIADDSADPELVAADLLGQAEHGPTSSAVLVTTSRELASDVLGHIARQLETLPTAEVAGTAWRERGEVVVVDHHDEAIAVADDHAPEHLEVQVADDDLAVYADRLRNYGSLFLGTHATVAYGDKGIGTNHVLPTGRAARYTGGLWVGKFLKTLTYQEVTAEGTERVAAAIAAISRAEGFEGHAITADMRLARAGVRR